MTFIDVMMDLIQLTEDDILYILGDVIDRGNGSLQILDYIMSHKNIKMLLENYEDLFLKWYYSKLHIFSYLKWKQKILLKYKNTERRFL